MTVWMRPNYYKLEMSIEIVYFVISATFFYS